MDLRPSSAERISQSTVEQFANSVICSSACTSVSKCYSSKLSRVLMYFPQAMFQHTVCLQYLVT